MTIRVSEPGTFSPREVISGEPQLYLRQSLSELRSGAAVRRRIYQTLPQSERQANRRLGWVVITAYCVMALLMILMSDIGPQQPTAPHSPPAAAHPAEAAPTAKG